MHGRHPTCKPRACRCPMDSLALCYVSTSSQVSKSRFGSRRITPREEAALQEGLGGTEQLLFRQFSRGGGSSTCTPLPPGLPTLPQHSHPRGVMSFWSHCEVLANGQPHFPPWPEDPGTGPVHTNEPDKPAAPIKAAGPYICVRERGARSLPLPFPSAV